jgi:hypothetical protein
MVVRIAGPERDGVTGGWRKFHNVYSSPNIIRVIKSKKIRWAGQGDEKCAQKFSWKA